MKLSIYVDQCTLEHWAGRIDCTDAILISFFQGLNADDPKIREKMWRGYFLAKRSWVLTQMPILGIADRALYRRLKKLRELGILDVLHRRVEGNKSLAYFRLSKTFRKIHDARHEAASDAAKNKTKAMVSEDHGSSESHGRLRPEPWSSETINKVLSINKEATVESGASREAADSTADIRTAQDIHAQKAELQEHSAEVDDIIGSFKRNHLTHIIADNGDTPSPSEGDDWEEIVDAEPDDTDWPEYDEEWPEEPDTEVPGENSTDDGAT